MALIASSAISSTLVACFGRSGPRMGPLSTNVAMVLWFLILYHWPAVSMILMYLSWFVSRGMREQKRFVGSSMVLARCNAKPSKREKDGLALL